MTDTTTNVAEKSVKPKKKKIYLYIALFGLVGIVLAVFMSYCQISHTQMSEISYGSMNILTYSEVSSETKILTYFDNSASVIVFTWSCIVSVLLAMLLPALTIKKCDLRCETKNSIFTVFASSLLGFLFAGYVVNFILIPLRHFWTNVEFPGPDFATMTPMLKIIFFCGIITSIPCAIYFLLIATQNEFRQNNRMCILSVFPVIWLALRLVFYFMSTSAHVNLAGRKLFIVSMVLSVIFFLQDAKRWLPKEESVVTTKEKLKNTKLYLATGFASVVTFSAYHLSMTFLQAFWIIKAEDTYLLNGIFIAMILFITFRLASVCHNKE